jgi:hypothetical protein
LKRLFAISGRVHGNLKRVICAILRLLVQVLPSKT